MGVRVAAVGVGGFGLRWGGAAVGGLAADDFELYGGVGDVESVAQGAVDGIEDGC